MTRIDSRGRNDAHKLAWVRLLVFAEIDDLDVLAGAVRVPEDEPLLSQPGKRRFSSLVSAPWINLEMNPPWPVLDAPFPVSHAPQPLKHPGIQRV